MKTIEIGTAKSEPGKLTYGVINGMDFPTGTIDQIPVMIAQGVEDGPTFFLTANVHGNELTGIAVIHETVTSELAQELRGTVVAFPTLSPTGLRRQDRSPEYDERDPNRLFPVGKFDKVANLDEEDKLYPRPFEQLAKKIFTYFEQYADFHIDFHNHSIRSIPYAILDRIFYQNESDKEEVTSLCSQQIAMVEPFGVLIVAEFPAKKYLKLKYYRTLSGATLNSLRIPAFTIELGANSVLMPKIVSGSVKGTRNVLRWAKMLESPKEEISEFQVPKPKERIRRCEHPRSKHSGLIKFLVNPGDSVKKGQAIAQITDIFGKPVEDGYIRTEFEGYMIALRSKMTVYPNDALAEMGIKDEEPLIASMQPEKD